MAMRGVNAGQKLFKIWNRRPRARKSQPSSLLTQEPFSAIQGHHKLINAHMHQPTPSIHASTFTLGTTHTRKSVLCLRVMPLSLSQLASQKATTIPLFYGYTIKGGVTLTTLRSFPPEPGTNRYTLHKKLGSFAPHPSQHNDE